MIDLLEWLIDLLEWLGIRGNCWESLIRAIGFDWLGDIGVEGAVDGLDLCYLIAFLVLKTGVKSNLSLIHISEPSRVGMISYAVFCLKKTSELKALFSLGTHAVAPEEYV